MITINRYHDFCAGHRVSGHEGKCAHLHGHNYRATFHIKADHLDDIGRVIDFSNIKYRLCEWLEEEWDHKFLMWDQDPLIDKLKEIVPNDIIEVPFNPTAENMAKYLCEIVGPKQLEGTGCELFKVEMQETRKCTAVYEI